MRYLLLLLVVLLIAWRWRTRRAAKDREPSEGSPQRPIEMLSCSHCGIHIAAHEATQGETGVYCSAAHKRLREA